jgi:hypothetical protein
MHAGYPVELLELRRWGRYRPRHETRNGLQRLLRHVLFTACQPPPHAFGKLRGVRSCRQSLAESLGGFLVVVLFDQPDAEPIGYLPVGAARCASTTPQADRTADVARLLSGQASKPG